MEQLLGIFTQRVNRDEKILSFAEGRQVTVRYELNDMKISFYTTLSIRAQCVAAWAIRRKSRKSL